MSLGEALHLRLKSIVQEPWEPWEQQPELFQWYGEVLHIQSIINVEVLRDVGLHLKAFTHQFKRALACR